MRTSLVPILLLATATGVGAAGSGVVTPPAPPAGARPAATAEARYNAGEAFAGQQQWKQAEAAYREATALRANFPEAWNGLGHALKRERRFPEALHAYEQALRLRPDYPQALEYLGETYVAMGRLDDARSTLARLKPLDAPLADRLARAIDGGGQAAGRW